MTEKDSGIQGEVLEVLKAEKEPLSQSDRFKVLLASFILELLLLGAGWASINFGWEIPPALLENVAMTIAGLAITFIVSRTYRNTAAK